MTLDHGIGVRTEDIWPGWDNYNAIEVQMTFPNKVQVLVSPKKARPLGYESVWGRSIHGKFLFINRANELQENITPPLITTRGIGGFLIQLELNQLLYVDGYVSSLMEKGLYFAANWTLDKRGKYYLYGAYQCFLLDRFVPGWKRNFFRNKKNLDQITAEFLFHAEDLVKKSGLSNQISFKEGDVHHLPFDDEEFDWVWSVDCVGYPGVGDPPPLVRELARVVRPGGKLAILTWTSQKLLPGYLLLEARLNVTSSTIIQHIKAKKPESNFMCALGWFHNADLEDVRARTFVGHLRLIMSNRKS